MKSTIFALSFGFVALILAVQNAHAAQATCAPRAEVLRQLSERYAETRQSIGLATNNTVIETYASPQGSWTIIVTIASGESCLVATGEHFESTAQTDAAKGEPA
jgi:predicted methyltransferase